MRLFNCFELINELNLKISQNLKEEIILLYKDS